MPADHGNGVTTVRTRSREFIVAELTDGRFGECLVAKIFRADRVGNVRHGKPSKRIIQVDRGTDSPHQSSLPTPRTTIRLPEFSRGIRVTHECGSSFVSAPAGAPQPRRCDRPPRLYRVRKSGR